MQIMIIDHDMHESFLYLSFSQAVDAIRCAIHMIIVPLIGV